MILWKLNIYWTYYSWSSWKKPKTLLNPHFSDKNLRPGWERHFLGDILLKCFILFHFLKKYFVLWFMVILKKFVFPTRLSPSMALNDTILMSYSLVSSQCPEDNRCLINIWKKNEWIDNSDKMAPRNFISIRSDSMLTKRSLA